MSEHREIRESLPHGGRGRDKAKRILRADPHKGSKVDASGYSPPDPLDADVKTGERPLSRRMFKRGGKVLKVHGEHAKHHAGKKPRSKHKKYGGPSSQHLSEHVNTDIREANEEREGSKHVGAFKRGGRAHRADGGSFVPTERMNFGSAGSSRMSKAAGLKRGGAAKHDDAAEDMALIKKAVKAEALKRKRGGKVHRAHRDMGGMLDDDDSGYNGHVDHSMDDNMPIITSSKAPPPKMPPAKPVARPQMPARPKDVRPQDPSVIRGRDVYEPIPPKARGGSAEIHHSSCKCHKCSGGSAHAHGGKVEVHHVSCGCHKCKAADRKGKSHGGSLDVMDGSMEGTRPTGFREVGHRSARKHGGRAKGKTNINIVIGAHGHPAGPPPGAGMPPAPPRGVPVPPPAPPMGGMPPGMPPGGPPGMMPPPGGAPPMPRKRGGRTLTATQMAGDHGTGAGGGLGRLAKIDAYGHYD